MQRGMFSEEFKRGAVKLVRQLGASKADIARDLSVGANLLGRWCRDQEGRSVPVRTGSGEVVSTQEFDSMRRELAKVKTERDTLKKALGYFAADPRFLIHKRRFPAAARFSRHNLQHELAWKLLGQLGTGKLLLNPEDRAAEQETVPSPRRPTCRCFRLH